MVPDPKKALIREKTALIFSEYSITSSLGYSGLNRTQKITANSTYWKAKLKGLGGSMVKGKGRAVLRVKPEASFS